MWFEQRIYDTLEMKLSNASDPEKKECYASQLEMMRHDRQQGQLTTTTGTHRSLAMVEGLDLLNILRFIVVAL